MHGQQCRDYPACQLCGCLDCETPDSHDEQAEFQKEQEILMTDDALLCEEFARLMELGYPEDEEDFDDSELDWTLIPSPFVKNPNQ
ncbi:MAG: hypothetical protein ABH956_01340 [Candidatus Nealsonbacteria bacterium]